VELDWSVEAEVELDWDVEVEVELDWDVEMGAKLDWGVEMVGWGSPSDAGGWRGRVGKFGHVRLNPL
jgi:hypothetical protein